MYFNLTLHLQIYQNIYILGTFIRKKYIKPLQSKKSWHKVHHQKIINYHKKRHLSEDIKYIYADQPDNLSFFVCFLNHHKLKFPSYLKKKGFTMQIDSTKRKRTANKFANQSVRKNVNQMPKILAFKSLDYLKSQKDDISFFIKKQ